MLERKDLLAIARSTLEGAIESPPHDAVQWSLRATSGTIGSPLLIFFQHKLGENTVHWPGGRTIVCYGSLSSRLSAALSAYKEQGVSSSSLYIDSIDLKPAITPCLAEFAPECVIGFPSFVVQLAEYMDAKTADAVAILQLTGEKLSATVGRYLKERFPNAEIRMVYGSMELGMASALPCKRLALNQYHLRQGFVAEIAEPDPEGWGDVLLTTVLNSTIPITRYKLGDIGRLLPIPCSCGRQTLEVSGRSGGDLIKLLGALVRREEFDRVLSSLSAPPDDYRVEAEAKETSGKLSGALLLQLYYKGQGPTDALKKEIVEHISRNIFLTPTKTLSQLVSEELFLPLSVEYTKKPFPAGKKDIKLFQRNT